MSEGQVQESYLRGTFEIEAGIIGRSLMLAAKKPLGFTVDDVERVEAYWVRLFIGLSSSGCVLTIDDGRRFEIIYDSGLAPDDETAGNRPESVSVRQMTTTEGFSASQEPPWNDDVAELNDFLGLPTNPNARSAALATRH